MTKRLISLFLVCILAIPIMVMPAHATGWDEDVDRPILDGILERLRRIDANIGGLYTEVSTNLYALLSNWRNNLTNQLAVWEAGMHSAISSLGSNISAYLSNLGTTISSAVKHMEDTIYSKLNEEMNRFVSRWDSILSVWKERYESVISKFESLNTTLTAFWFDMELKLEDIKNILLGKDSDLQNSEQFQEEVNKQETQIDEFEEIISTQPTFDNDAIEGFYDSSLDIVDMGDAQYMFFIQSILSLEVLVLPFAIASIFAILGYILYGKRS